MIKKQLVVVLLCLLTACANGTKLRSSTQKNAAHLSPAQVAQANVVEPRAAEPRVAESAPVATADAIARGAESPAAAASPSMSPGTAAFAPPPSSTEGYLVASVDEIAPVDVQVLPKSLNGLLPLTGSYQLKVRKAGGEPIGTFGAAHNTFDLHANDLDTLRRFGFVTVKELPPGNYEIYSYVVKWREGKDKDKAVASAEPFTVPFTIAAGKTTYLGNFGAVGFKQENQWGYSVPAGAYFVVSDKADRDLEIARRKMPEIGPVTKQVPDPEKLAIPGFKSSR